MSRFVTRFLLQLSGCANRSQLLHAVSGSSWNFQCLTIQCIAVLAHHQDFAVFRHRKHCCCALSMCNIIPVCNISTWRLHHVVIHVHNGTLIFQHTVNSFHFVHAFLPPVNGYLLSPDTDHDLPSGSMQHLPTSYPVCHSYSTDQWRYRRAE